MCVWDDTMGHYYISLKDRHVLLHDMTIWSLRHFCVVAASEIDCSVEQFFAGWQWHGPGVFTGTDLHEFAGDDARRLALLHEAFVSAQSLVLKFGDEIPLDYLKDNINLRCAYFTKPLKVRELTDAISQIIEMLRD